MVEMKNLIWIIGLSEAILEPHGVKMAILNYKELQLKVKLNKSYYFRNPHFIQYHYDLCEIKIYIIKIMITKIYLK